jgi:hypothetical protein
MTSRAVLLPILFSLLAPSLTAARQDDLEPSEGIFSRSGSSYPYYEAVGQSLVREHLYRKCQMVVLPSFEREWAVYIVREEGSPATVIFKRVRKQLWLEMGRASAEQGGGTRAKTEEERQRAVLAQLKPDVDRWATPISNQVADALEEVWWRMLSRIRYPQNRRDGTDGASYSLAHWRNGVAFMSGETWSPADGSRTRALVALGEQMAAFSQAPSAQKEGALGADARRLLVRLSRLRTTP